MRGHPLYSKTCLYGTLWWEDTLYAVKPVFQGHSDERTPSIQYNMSSKDTPNWEDNLSTVTPVFMGPSDETRLWDCHSFYDFYAFQWNYMAIRWNAMEFHGMPWNSMECHGRYVIYMEFQRNSMASRWNPMEFHGIQKIGTLTKLVSGSKQWK